MQVEVVKHISGASNFIEELISQKKAHFVPEFLIGHKEGDAFKLHGGQAAGFKCEFKKDTFQSVSLLDVCFSSNGTYRVVKIGVCRTYYGNSVNPNDNFFGLPTEFPFMVLKKKEKSSFGIAMIIPSNLSNLR